MANLTRGRLEAIIDALSFSIEMRQVLALNAPLSDYRKAHAWASDELAKREGRVARKPPAKPFEDRNYDGK